MRSLFSKLFSRKDGSRREKEGPQTTAENGLIFQAFEWNVEADHQHWKRLHEELPRLKTMGVTSIWIPPGCKAMDGASGNGYDIYDLYDLGEFDQKGSTPTKWGSREDLEVFAKRAEELGVEVYWDAVLNHKAGADGAERFRAVEVELQDRTVSRGEPREIEGWSKFDFPGRGDRYSAMKYNWHHFSGLDWDETTRTKGIFKILGDGKDWADDVSKEHGNYDYLIFTDIDYSNAEVREDVKNWVQWLGGQLPISGLRLDAAKHYSRAFLKEFIHHIRETVGPNWFLVAEYWKGEVDVLLDYLKAMEHLVSLFDVPLVHRFSDISRMKGADMRKVFTETLVKREPAYAVTFVMNHDTQPGQSLEIPIKSWFKQLAYSLILLRQDGYPCLFYGDLYGINACPSNPSEPPVANLSTLALARKLYAYGEQRDYFNQKNCIGFVRKGDSTHPFGLACVLNNNDESSSSKRMNVGRQHAGEEWTEVFGQSGGIVTIDRCGIGSFGVKPLSVSVWVNANADGRERFAELMY